jgi:hypothetical protein
MSTELSQHLHAAHDSGVQQAILTEMRFLREAVGEVKTTVASYPALIERQAATEQRQQETENRFVDALEKVESSIIRIHERMDEVRDIVQRDMIDVKEQFRSFREEHRREVTEMITTSQSVLITQMGDLTKKVTETKSETETWINQGKGAWKAASILWGAIQAVVVALMVWFFSEVQSIRDWKNVAEYKFQMIEQRHKGEDDSLPKPTATIPVPPKR